MLSKYIIVTALLGFFAVTVSAEKETPSIKCVTPIICSKEVSYGTIHNIDDNDGDISIDENNLKNAENSTSRNLLPQIYSFPGDKSKPKALFNWSIFGKASSIKDSKWKWDKEGFKNKAEGLRIYEGYGKGNSILDLGEANIIGNYRGKLVGGGKFNYDDEDGNENRNNKDDDEFNYLSGEGNARFNVNYYDDNIGRLDISDVYDSYNKFNKEVGYSNDNAYRNDDGTINEYDSQAASNTFLDKLGFPGEIKDQDSLIDSELINKKYLNQLNDWKLDENIPKDNLFKRKNGDNYEFNVFFGNKFSNDIPFWK
ncbi:hypothetical protein O3M35_009477 [Rhynocoris fuscipes]|uniref:Uncharacterized protein n=1 Tax=Rhynocoris fuscipes TaxID=488301 RepID=A0AAW1D8F3_9HEMI